MPHRLPAVRQSLHRLTSVGEQLAELGVRQGQGRVDRHGGSVGFQALVVLAGGPQRGPAVVLSDEEVGPTGQGRVVLRDRLVVSDQFMRGQAQVAEGFREVRPQERCGSWRRPLHTGPTPATPRPGWRDRRRPARRDRPADQLGGTGEGAALVVQDAKEVQHRRVVGVALQQGVVDAGRVGAAAGLVQRERGLHVYAFDRRPSGGRESCFPRGRGAVAFRIHGRGGQQGSPVTPKGNDSLLAGSNLVTDRRRRRGGSPRRPAVQRLEGFQAQVGDGSAVEVAGRHRPTPARGYGNIWQCVDEPIRQGRHRPAKSAQLARIAFFTSALPVVRIETRNTTASTRSSASPQRTSGPPRPALS